MSRAARSLWLLRRLNTTRSIVDRAVHVDGPGAAIETLRSIERGISAELEAHDRAAGYSRSRSVHWGKPVPVDDGGAK